jgi:hypothetical protein
MAMENVITTGILEEKKNQYFVIQKKKEVSDVKLTVLQARSASAHVYTAAQGWY